MIFLTTAECVSWLNAHDMIAKSVLRATGDVSVHNFDNLRDRSTLIADEVCKALFSTTGQTLLWVKEFGIWKSLENRYLHERVRLSYAERSGVNDRPGHLFFHDEFEDCKLFCDLCIRHGWGALVANSDQESISFDHDGGLSVGWLGAKQLDSLLEALAGLSLRSDATERSV